MWERGATEALLGSLLSQRGEFAEAERHLLSAHEGLARMDEPVPLAARRQQSLALNQLVTLYERWGRDDARDRWQRIRALDRSRTSPESGGAAKRFP